MRAALGYSSGGDSQVVSLGSSLLLHTLFLVAVFGGVYFPGKKAVRIPVAYEVRLVTLPSPSIPPTSAPSSPPVKSASPPPSEELSLPRRRNAPRAEASAESLTLAPRLSRSTALPAPPAVTSPAAGSPGSAGSPEEGVSVENADPRLTYYRALLEYKVSSAWILPLVRGAQPSPVVSVKILRNGQVRDVRLETSSGDRSMDDSALRAIRLAQPFPPLPPLFPDEFASFQIGFHMGGGR